MTVRPLALGLAACLPAPLLSARRARHRQPAERRVDAAAREPGRDHLLRRRAADSPLTPTRWRGLFKYHVDQRRRGRRRRDRSQKDAHTTPGTFSPQCGLSGTIVLHGGGCKNALGWYNATEPATTPADRSTPLVPADLQPPARTASAWTNDFCPLATRTTHPAVQHTWADPLPEFAANIRTDTNWAGGPVGFALIGCAGTGSARRPSTRRPSSTTSRRRARRPTARPGSRRSSTSRSPTRTPTTSRSRTSRPARRAGRAATGSQTMPLASGGNDGDFNDFVFYVSGLSCSGGGQPCTVPNQMGICAGGVTECAAAARRPLPSGGHAARPRSATASTTTATAWSTTTSPVRPPASSARRGVCVHPCDTQRVRLHLGLHLRHRRPVQGPRCIGKTCGIGSDLQRRRPASAAATASPARTARSAASATASIPARASAATTGACARTAPASRRAATAATARPDGPARPPVRKRRVRRDRLPEQDLPGRPGLRGGQLPGRLHGRDLPGRSGVHERLVLADPDARRRHAATADRRGDLGRRWLRHDRTRRELRQRRHDRHGRRERGRRRRSAAAAPHIGGITSCSCDAAGGPGVTGVLLMLAALGLAALRRRRDDGSPARARVRR